MMKDQGIITFSIRGMHYLLNKILSCNKLLLLYEIFIADEPPKIQAKIKADVSIASIDTFDTLEIGEKIKGVLINSIKKGDLCFIIVNDKKLIHHSCLSFKNRYRPPIDNTVVIRKNEAYIYGCWTSPEYRGIGLYPYMLTKILHYLREKNTKRVFIDMWANNMASIRGVEKAGFHKLGIYRRFQILTMIDIHLTTKRLKNRFLDTNKIRLKIRKIGTKN